MISPVLNTVSYFLASLIIYYGKAMGKIRGNRKDGATTTTTTTTTTVVS